MTKQEFEDRTGLHVSEKLFNCIHSIYMNAGENMDKDIFCKDYKKHGDSKILNALHDRVVALEKERNRLSNDKRITAISLIRETAANKSMTLRNLAIVMLGPNTYLREKIKLGIAFDSDDYELVTEFL